MSLCRPATEVDFEALKMIEKYYSDCDEEYLQSDEFTHFLSWKCKRIIKDHVNKSKHIRDVLTELMDNP